MIRPPALLGIALVAIAGCSAGTTQTTPLPTAPPSASATATPGAPSATPSPTHSPLVTPTPAAPPSGLSLSPASLTFIDVGLNSQQNFVVTDNAANAAPAESDTCTGIASIALGMAAAPSFSYAVLPVAAGTCVATVTEPQAGTITIAISVTTNGITIQSRGRTRQ
jgi:hypothetical protein